MKNYIERWLPFIKYSIVGGICTILNLILFYVLVQIGVHYIAANVISYVLAIVLNYLLNKCFVFLGIAKSKKRNGKVKRFSKFLCIRLLNMLFDNIVFYSMVTVLRRDVFLTRIVLTIGGLVFSYYFINRFVFTGNEAEE